MTELKILLMTHDLWYNAQRNTPSNVDLQCFFWIKVEKYQPLLCEITAWPWTDIYEVGVTLRQTWTDNIIIVISSKIVIWGLKFSEHKRGPGNRRTHFVWANSSELSFLSPGGDCSSRRIGVSSFPVFFFSPAVCLSTGLKEIVWNGLLWDLLGRHNWSGHSGQHEDDVGKCHERNPSRGSCCSLPWHVRTSPCKYPNSSSGICSLGVLCCSCAQLSMIQSCWEF